MKTVLLFLMSFGLILNAIGQDPLNEKINLTDNEQLFKAFKFKEEGIVVITTLFPGEKKNNSINVRFYSLDFKVKWEKNIKLFYKDRYPTINVTYSPYSDFFYVIENVVYISNKDRIMSDPGYITQISKDGNIKGVESKGYLKRGLHEDLAFVTTKNYLNIYRVKENTVFVDRYNNSDLTLKSFELPIPAVTVSKDNFSNISFWHFAAQSEEKIYFARNEYLGFTKSDESDLKYFIVSVNEEGQIQDNITLNPGLKSCYPLASARSDSEGPLVSEFQTLSWRDTYTYYQGQVPGSKPEVSGLPQGSMLDVYVYSVGNLSFDFKDNSVYVTGMMSRKYIKPTVILQKPDGYFLIKFDLQGNVKWQIINDFDKEYLKNLAPGPHMRFLFVSNGLLLINGDFVDAKDFLTVSFENDGKVIKNTIIPYADLSKAPSENPTPAQKYLKSLNLPDVSKEKPEEKRYQIIQPFSAGEILIDYDPKNKAVNIYSFPE